MQVKEQSKIDFIKECFEKESYQLLSKYYKGCHQKIDFICPNGHRHSISWTNWKRGQRCGKCSHIYNVTHKAVKKAFEKENYTLLSKEYKNNNTKLNFICPNGHRHSISWSAWQQGQRCGKCSNYHNVTYEIIRKAFEKENYKLLSKEYKNANIKLDFICPNGHKHSIAWNAWQQGVRCGKCSNHHNVTYETVKESFEERGYILLSKEYKNTCTKLNFICPNGHKHSIAWSKWRQGIRCGKCRFITYENIKKSFEKERYILLSKNYKNAHVKLRFICPNGHKHSIAWSAWQQGVRCGKCSNFYNVTYEMIKESFEKEKYALLSKEYKGTHSKLDFVCPKNHKCFITWANWKLGHRCGKCHFVTIRKVKKSFEKEKYTLLSKQYKNSNIKLNFICSNGHEHSITWADWKQGHRCGKCNTNKAETEIFNYFKNKANTVQNTRKIISPLELDFYFPENKVAVEYCGLYWHSDIQERMTSNYHRNKLNLCQEKDIRLITVFEDEWLENKDICLSRINAALNISQNRIFARKCEVKEVDKKEAKQFYSQTHLQGYGKCRTIFGLYHKDELVLAASIGVPTRAHTSKGKKVLELKRISSKLNTIVVGGVSKLFKRIKEYANENDFEIIKSYCDLRWGTGGVYEKLGMTKTHETKWTPHYIKGQKRFRNQTLALKKEDRENYPGMTEYQIRQQQGYSRIYDCGHQTWECVIQ